MDIFTLAPFTSGAITWQEQADQWNLTVVCKATYTLKPGTSPLAPEPEGINERDNHWDDDPQKSLYAPSDLAPFKPSPEVLLVGSAYAPRGETVRSLFVRILVGELDKSIEVFGPRSFGSDGALVESRWTQMPLRYERAAGGGDSWNPVGVDSSVPDAYGRRSLPNLQPPGVHVVAPSEFIAATGFGPIAARWPLRLSKLGPLAGAFSDERWTETPLGADLDGAYFQSAPLDQLVPELRPDEKIILENLLPEHPRLSTNLAGVRPRARVEIEGLPSWEIDLVADTLWIDTNRSLCTLTWRGQIPLDGRDQPGRIFIGVEEAGQAPRFPEPPAAVHPVGPGLPLPVERVSAPDDDSSEETQTDDHALLRGMVDVLPFAPPGRVAVMPVPPAPPAGKPVQRRSQQPIAQLDETGVFNHHPRSRMPSWLAAPAAPGTAAPPALPGGPPAPPPPVSQILRPSEPAPFDAFAASNAAALQERSLPSPPAARIPAPPPPPRMRTPMPTLHGIGAPAPIPGGGVAQAPVLAQPVGGIRPGTTIGQAATAAANAANAAPAPPPPPSPSRPPPPDVKRHAGKPDPRVLATAAFLGAAEASNAAAHSPEPQRTESSQDKQAAASSAGQARSLIEIVWFSPDAPVRVRQEKAFEDLFDDRENDEPRDPPTEGGEIDAAEGGEKKGAKAPDKPPTDDPKAARAAVGRVLSRGNVVFDVKAALAASAGEDGVIEEKLIVVAGDLELPFDELETLKVVVSAAAPLGSADKKLKETLDLANEVQNTPLGQSPEVAQNFSLQVREAWLKANRMLPADYLDVHSRRVLLEQRKYQLRELSGASWIRALLHGLSGDRPVPTYLPKDLSKKLPLFMRFPARLIAEVVPQQDQSEAHPVALRVLALARQVLARPGGR